MSHFLVGCPTLSCGAAPAASWPPPLPAQAPWDRCCFYSCWLPQLGSHRSVTHTLKARKIH